MTTFFALLPMMLETSLQAQFLIPMAVSLGFGILFATVIILVGVPTATKLLELALQHLGIRRQPLTGYSDAEDTAGLQPGS